MSSDVTLIGLTGLAGTGKDSAAAYLCEQYGFVQASFADPIRSMAHVFLEEAGLDHAWLFERSRKELDIPGLGVSARALMQTLGTEVGRALSPNLWIKHLALRLGLDDNAGSAPVHDRIVVSDVRFVNEAAWLRARRGCLVRLHRNSAPAVRLHASEQQVLDLPASVDLFNHGPTLEGLHTLLDGVMADLQVSRREALEGYMNPSFG